MALQDGPRRVTFLAKVRSVDFPKVVVKFMSKYSKDAHEFLAARGYIPRLWYCGRLLGDDDTIDGGDLLPAEIPPGPAWTSSRLVSVLDFMEPRASPTPEDPHQQIRQVLTELHFEGYVHDDLRSRNILPDSNDKIKLIGIDYAGRYGMNIREHSTLPSDLQKGILRRAKDVGQAQNVDFAYYPMGLSQEIPWAPGVSDLTPIRPRHDWYMLSQL